MLKKIRSCSYESLVELLFGFFILSFCISMKLSNLVMMLLVVMVIYGLVAKKLKFKFIGLNLLFVLFYLFYFFGFFFTRNSELASFYLENKLPFLVIPFIFSFYDSSKIQLDKLNNYLIIGVLTLGVLGIINGLHCKLFNLNEYCFSTTSFSFIHHPTYFLVFNCISFSFLALQYFQNKTVSFYKVLFYLIASFGIHILSLSLAGILFFAFVVTVFSIYFFYTKFNRTIFYVSLLLMILLSVLASTQVRVLKNELRGASKYVRVYISSPTDFVKNSTYPMEGNHVRLIMWTVAYKACSEHLLGVGTGNVDEVLKQKLMELKQLELVEFNYNPHNQFLQTFLEIGMLGFSLLVLIIALPIYFGIRYKKYILVILSLSLFFNCLFESMLQRQSGIVFYTFFLCLFYSHYIYSKKST
jgi:O-antigen ligase